MSRIDDSDPQVQYSGQWMPELDAHASGGTRHGTNDEQATALLKFTGSSIQVFGIIVSTDGDPVSIYYVDNQFVVDFTGRPSEDNSYGQLFMSKSGLDPGDHEIRVENMNGGPGQIFWLDYFLVDPDVQSSLGETHTPPQHSSQTRTISGLLSKSFEGASSISLPMSTISHSAAQSDSRHFTNTTVTPSLPSHWHSIVSSSVAIARVSGTASTSAVGNGPETNTQLPHASVTSGAMGGSGDGNRDGNGRGNGGGSAQPSPARSKIEPIIGGVIGGLLLLIVTIVFFFVRRRRRVARQDDATSEHGGVSEASTTVEILRSPSDNIVAHAGSPDLADTIILKGSASPSGIEKSIPSPRHIPSLSSTGAVLDQSAHEPDVPSQIEEKPILLPDLPHLPPGRDDRNRASLSNTMSTLTRAPSFSTDVSPPSTLTGLHMDEVAQVPWSAPAELRSQAHALVQTASGRRVDRRRGEHPLRAVDSGVRMYPEEDMLPPAYTAD